MLENPTETDERVHLAWLTELLKRRYSEIKASVASRHAEMMQIKQQLQDQVRDLDHADKANLRQAANMASRVGEFSVDQQQRLEKLINSPYFGRIDVRSVDQPQAKAIYIGLHALAIPTTVSLSTTGELPSRACSTTLNSAMVITMLRTDASTLISP